MAPDAPMPGWRDRWNASPSGVVVLDLGLQPTSDVFPTADDPGPDPAARLRMVYGLTSGLLQLEHDPTTPTEVVGLEPAALRRQATASVADAAAAGLVVAGSRVRHHASPHGGSWREALEPYELVEVADGEADLVVDVHGMMHEADQRAALEARRAELAPGGALLFLIHDAASFVRQRMWHALRTGHYAYYTVPALVGMAGEVGLVPVGAWTYPLYQNGTTMLAFARADAAPAGGRPEEVQRLIVEAEAAGATDPARLAEGLSRAHRETVTALRGYLDRARAEGLRVAGYGAASRTVALLASAGVTADDLVLVADSAEVKHGRRMPGTRIRIGSPADLVAAAPDRVLLFLGDLLDEVRAALPGIEAGGARWVVVDPAPCEVEPVQPAPPPSDAA